MFISFFFLFKVGNYLPSSLKTAISSIRKMKANWKLGFCGRRRASTLRYFRRAFLAAIESVWWGREKVRESVGKCENVREQLPRMKLKYHRRSLEVLCKFGCIIFSSLVFSLTTKSSPKFFNKPKLIFFKYFIILSH